MKEKVKSDVLQPTEDTFNHEEFQFKESIEIKIPDIIVNNSPSSNACLCERPLRSLHAQDLFPQIGLEKMILISVEYWPRLPDSMLHSTS